MPRIMKRAPLEIVTLRGTPLEVAYQLGRLRKGKISRVVEYWNRLLAARYRGRKSERLSLERSFLQAAQRQAPHYLEEIFAMAEGAGVPWEELFRLNITELHIFAEKCSTLIFPIQTDRGHRMFVAHNEDWDSRRNDVFILRAALPTVTYVVIAYDGYLPGLSSGINSFGLIHALNFLKPRDLRPRLPRIFVTRHMVTARNFSDCLRWIRQTDRAFGQTIHLAQGSEYLGLEITARQMALRQPRLPTLHTNHYLAEELLPLATAPSRSSWHRLMVGRDLLERAIESNRGKPFTRNSASAVARKILSDQSGLPYSIWREGDQKADPGATVATAFFGTDSNRIEVFRKKPLISRPLRFDIPRESEMGG